MHSEVAESVKCSFCGFPSGRPFLSLGSMELAGAFKKRANDIQQSFPLELTFCENCYGVEVLEKIDPTLLFSDYFYFSSKIGTLINHFEDYARTLGDRLLIEPGNTSVLEIGCNDGILLKPLLENGYRTVIGVDPAKNVISQIDLDDIILYPEFFSEELASKILNEHGPLDIVVANNVFAHINYISGAIKGVKRILSETGTFIFEVHSLKELLAKQQFDMIYHEHVYYYSALSCVKIFSLYDLCVYDVENIGSHGGSLRVFVTHPQNMKNINSTGNLSKILKEESFFGLDNYKTFLNYGSAVASWREKFSSKLAEFKASGKRIFGYGASGRANTLLQYCGIDHKTIDVMLDDNPAKHGHFTPGSNIPIKDPSYLKTVSADVIVIFAWTFSDEITRRLKALDVKAELLVPLPEIRSLKGH